MKKRNVGFTLVELLVVIGIIALLISILLPALGRVRAQANITRCSVQMRDVIMAANMYANENRGALPPFSTDYGKPDFNMHYGASVVMLFSPRYWNTAAAPNFDAIVTPPTAAGVVRTPQLDPGALYGRLYRGKYLRTSKLFICPSAAETGYTETSGRDGSYYSFNAHIKYVNSSAGLVAQPRWKRLPGYGKDSGSGQFIVEPGKMTAVAVSATPTDMTFTPWRRALMTDSMYSYYGPSDNSSSSHIMGKRRAFNLGYPDGSVLTAINTLDGSSVMSSNNDMNYYIEMSNALQASVDGQDINFKDSSSWRGGKFRAFPVNP